MDNEVNATTPAALVCHALIAAGVEVVQLWWEYVRLGGQATAIEVEAHLRHNLWLPSDQQDLLAQAAHGLLSPGTTSQSGRRLRA
ncbi:hypothetical protein [Kocuria arenosa]|uniref:hypothetical protein n=1 Tax=Kocuria arenosa TaxID=3071446 RepID=UPI0034D74703